MGIRTIAPRLVAPRTIAPQTIAPHMFYFPLEYRYVIRNRQRFYDTEVWCNSIALVYFNNLMFLVVRSRDSLCREYAEHITMSIKSIDKPNDIIDHIGTSNSQSAQSLPS